MNDKAIVLTSFGTTLTEERKRTLKHMQRLTQQAYPDWDVYIAFTSRILSVRGTNGRMTINCFWIV